MNNYIFVFLISLALSFVITKFVMVLAKRTAILDYPKDQRKIHQQPMPLLGGVAIFFSFIIAVFILWQSHQLLDERISWSIICWFLLAGLILIINGFLDDKFSWPAHITIWGPIIASILIIIGGLKITYITHPDGGVLYLDNLFTWLFQWGGLEYSFSWLTAIITFIWLMSITYTTKLLDGIDGLTTSVGLIASLVIFIVSLSWDVVGSTTSLLSLSLAGILLGFLIWNWHPAKIFLGEGGSTFIGFSLGVLAIISGSKIATALLVMGLPFLDVIWVIFWRLKKGQNIFKGDRQHLHFRLLSLGLSQRQIVVFLSLISLCFGLVSIFFTTKAKISALIILLVFMFLLSIWLNYRLRRINEEG
ncbi:MAG: hypothetical protein COV55_01130 [Candidatus Komeilibacteria bacterium CG11_big_fil_rev_8_21_14_0_20_36_20]|uniref:Undecaprenyl-phosphate alpha-N-acetylglucosaminyl 1-phosphate transferase n=1 Tax=Candidatus Komeilibacteria bacterium CG11_big_fil_rev_8_21_14_0_20_36_20 TaxID=1974477 RepID=A0A2H0NDP9_9BACT|nr:MAG: hypothetical protein COV55_01130 [Candidatus Komeilibacteria bacterium CG11_big_fil_rev_8_21_14_0_20_36_20]PIR81383.1 MAG: hypothetical protein COU21_04100 [Candidatus Komeilibacteria bacterium CG10_big_fil_rev_8_21_14_0_10_36_65]PJC55108.1 MAG: hypothetical protein CO027_03055 [Candidatus Komeilibacteria bacterium CG_4_9_14_0_2_um_filter_36_13]